MNSTGGGIVTKIIDSRMVAVEVEGGFELPILCSELIRMNNTEPAARYFDENFNIEKSNISVEEKILSPDDEVVSQLPANLVKTRKSEDILLAFIPHEQKWLISGMVDIMVINNSSYDLLYNIFLMQENGSFLGKDYGSLGPDSKLLIDTVTRETLALWCQGCIQFLFHKETTRQVLPPFNSEFKISGKKFYQEASYKDSPYFGEKALFIKVLSLSGYFDSKKPPIRKIKPEMSGDSASLIEKHSIAPLEAEVDLHIHELLDESDSIDKDAILDYQKNYVEQCLDSAVARHYRKITFIHGVGNGVLRKALIEILERSSGWQFYDAPMQKYGVGAIEVRIPQN
ncbi:MAG: DUF2027 domain-containing protein [Bacteroidota bacterium]